MIVDIAEELFKYNPWWEQTYSPPFIPRRYYLDILQKNLSNKDIVLITGLRRVGKTTMMKMFITKLLQKLEPRFILYVSLDAIPLEPFSISDILRAYRKVFQLSLEEKVYLFFDEVANRPKIHQELKNLYDRENVKIFASSSSASILQDTRALLTGRARIIEVMPLDFEEFLEFKGLKPRRSESYLLESHFEKYMQMGGMPEYVITEDISYLENLIEGIIYKDIISLHGLRDVSGIKDMCRLIMERSGKQISINKIAKVMGVSPDTVRRYLEYFRQTFLIYTIERCGKLNERLRAPRKIYAADVGIRNYFTGFRDKGAVFENLVYLKIKNRRPCYVYQNGLELDFYFDDTLLEVKYEKELDGKQAAFFEQFPAERKMKVLSFNDYLNLTL